MLFLAIVDEIQNRVRECVQLCEQAKREQQRRVQLSLGEMQGKMTSLRKKPIELNKFLDEMQTRVDNAEFDPRSVDGLLRQIDLAREKNAKPLYDEYLSQFQLEFAAECEQNLQKSGSGVRGGTAEAPKLVEIECPGSLQQSTRRYQSQSCRWPTQRQQLCATAASHGQCSGCGAAAEQRRWRSFRSVWRLWRLLWVR